jgi:Cys-rich repeat protein
VSPGHARRLAAAILVGAAALASCHGDIRFGDLATCTADADCLLPSLHCNAGRCVQCAKDTHCGPGAPRCDTTQFRCVACVMSSDCAGGYVCKTGLCAPPCTGGCPMSSRCDDGACVQCDDGLGCASSPAGPYCVGHACASCRDDSDCGGATPRCDGVARRCVQCEAHTDCTAAATPLCDIARGTCVALP